MILSTTLDSQPLLVAHSLLQPTLLRTHTYKEKHSYPAAIEPSPKYHLHAKILFPFTLQAPTYSFDSVIKPLLS